MTPKQLRIRVPYGIIERDGEAPIVVAGWIEIEVKPPRGRPKATEKHAAVVMAFWFEHLKLGKHIKEAYKAVAERFGYDGEREVRRIINGRQNPFRSEGHFVIPMDLDGGGELIVATPDAVETETAIDIGGRGWVWRPGTAEAVYGELRGGGMLNREAPRGGGQKYR